MSNASRANCGRVLNRSAALSSFFEPARPSPRASSPARVVTDVLTARATTSRGCLCSASARVGPQKGDLLRLASTMSQDKIANARNNFEGHDYG